jgi:hypothetical protein
VVEGNNFLSRFNLINSRIEGGLDFVFFEEFSSGFEFVLESSEHGSNSLEDISNKIRGINSRDE